ncbi:hypothetical protein ACFORG_14005 [Lutimaribacter marinistellae]|uniref:Uncharacterized protein n=1 Tax=Lutimaribacter marinistellae TaxID=1820329 RepID=A0ABV7THU1_9RHOB
MQDRVTFSENTGIAQEVLVFSDFITSGYDDVDDVLRPIYEEASEVLGQEFPYPGDE